MNAEDYRRAIVSVRERGNEAHIIGTGFVVFYLTDYYILTCAHVVADALEGSSNTETYIGEEVVIEFAFSSNKEKRSAEVVYYVFSKDLAILKLRELVPEGIKGIQLKIIDDKLWNVEFRVLGFPVGHDSGTWATGVVRDRIADNLLQIEDIKTEGQPIKQGFSGAPVWSDKLLCVIGMIVSFDRKESTKIAFVLPVDTLVDALNDIPRDAEILNNFASLKELKIDKLFRLVNERPDPILFLGAGASVKSGILLLTDLVVKAVRHAFCVAHGRDVEDYTIRRSDWLPWLEEQDWYTRTKPLESQYIEIFTNLFSLQDRQMFFQQHSRSLDIEPSNGYTQLLNLVGKQRIFTILTTNFDNVLPSLADKMTKPHNLVRIETPDNYQNISTAPRHPQLIFLHGSVSYYSNNYFFTGYKQLQSQLVSLLCPLLRDHPIIVVGYSGREQSIMQNLFLDQLEYTSSYANGIYWCILEEETETDIHRNVLNLAHAIGKNFHLIKIKDFDYLMKILVSFARARSDILDKVDDVKQNYQHQPDDMELVLEATLDDLDWSEITLRLLEYARKLAINVPSKLTREWFIRQMIALDLAQELNGTIHPTVAGYLLFTGSHENDNNELYPPPIEVHVVGNETSTQLYKGNLWQQLKVIDDIENEFNVPFRLKGLNSEVVTPYPSLALKELIVNAIVHRKYDGDAKYRPIKIYIENGLITIVSPGSLHTTIYTQFPENVAPEEGLGVHKVKAYRNPVIADMFYSSGDMDRLGSGLVDVRKQVRQIGGNIAFRLGVDDTFFQVTISKRPEQPDNNTHAATTRGSEIRYISNLLEVSAMPEILWFAETSYRYVPNLKAEVGDTLLPAFTLSKGRLYTFSNLSIPTNPLRKYVDKRTVQSELMDNFASNEASSRQLVNLLNSTLENHVQGLGLIFDWEFKRAYYSRDEHEQRKVEYQARLRKATRTVVKAHKIFSSDKINYWEHQAVSFQFRQFEKSWALHLLPTYVFTTDGNRDFLPPERNSALATRKISREYNPQVDNHLVFWASILSNSQTEIILENDFGSYLALRSTTTSFVIRDIDFQGEDTNEPPTEEEVEELGDALWDETLDEDDYNATDA